MKHSAQSPIKHNYIYDDWKLFKIIYLVKSSTRIYGGIMVLLYTGNLESLFVEIYQN